MQYILELLAVPEVQAALVALSAVVFALVKKVEAVRRWRLARAVECVEAGVRETYEEYVRAMKAASIDGKLTDEERAEARRRAIERAKDYAAREGVDLLKVYAKTYLPVLVEKILRRDKAAAALPFAFSEGPEADWL